MHAVAGLLELGRPQEALSYLTEIRGTAAEFDNTLRTHIAAPQIVGLLLGKAAEASERGIRLEISPETWLSESPDKVQVLTTVVGNLVDNAMDAVTGRRATRRVEVEIVEDADLDHRRRDATTAPAYRPSWYPDLPRRIHHQDPARRTGCGASGWRWCTGW